MFGEALFIRAPAGPFFEFAPWLRLAAGGCETERIVVDCIVLNSLLRPEFLTLLLARAMSAKLLF